MLMRREISKKTLYFKMSVKSESFYNACCAVDPFKQHRAPKIIWTLGRHKAASPEVPEFIAVPKHERKRKPPEMKRNPNYERGFKLANAK